MSAALNKVKDGLIRAADLIEDHPWITMGILALLTVAAFAGLVAVVL